MTELQQEHRAALRSGRRGLRADVRAVSTLRDREIGAMFELYASYYDATARTLFERDLGQKHWAVILTTDDDQVAGFSSLAILDATCNGTTVQAIYSGDTIIDRAYWGTQALAFTWIRFAGTIKRQSPDLPLYWFLIVKGHRTYRYLSAFSIDFFPHWTMATPPWARQLMDELASQRFAGFYEAERGVVSFPESRGHLKPIWARAEPEELARPDVAFFLRKNPGYVRGDELVCLTELSSDNLRPLARRVFDEGLRG